MGGTIPQNLLNETRDPMINPSSLNGASFAGLSIGLLGGSFNPAHAGHRMISLYALKKLGLDQIWWLVSPQNPLKAAIGMKPLAVRLAGARRVIAGHPRLCATAIETALGTRYTIDTLRALRQRMPKTRFVWLMGADNLKDVRRWRRWTHLFDTTPIAVFARPGYAVGKGQGLAAGRYASAFVGCDPVTNFARRRAPAWCLLGNPKSHLSATALRQKTKKSF